MNDGLRLLDNLIFIVHCPLSIVTVHCPLSIVHCPLPFWFFPKGLLTAPAALTNEDTQLAPQNLWRACNPGRRHRVDMNFWRSARGNKSRALLLPILAAKPSLISPVPSLAHSVQRLCAKHRRAQGLGLINMCAPRARTRRRLHRPASAPATHCRLIDCLLLDHWLFDCSIFAVRCSLPPLSLV